MATLSKTGISNGSIIQISHITQSIDALTGQGTNYDITISGSLGVTGSFKVINGNVGIGITNPTSLLQISSPINPNQNILFVSGSGEIPNVGIGTTSPQGPLHIKGTSLDGVTPAIFLDTTGFDPNEPVDIRLASGNAKGIRIIASSSLSNFPGGASISVFSNTSNTFGGYVIIASGNTATSAIIFRTANNNNEATIERMQIAGNGTVSVTGSLATIGAITSSGAISSSAGLFGTNLTATGNVTIGGTLNVTGTTTLAGALTALNISASSNISSSTLRTTSNTAIGGTLNVTGTTTLAGALTALNISASSNISSSTLHTTSNTAIGGTLTTIGAITSSGAISSSAGLLGTVLTLTPYTSWPPTPNPPEGSLAISGSGAAMRLMLHTGSNNLDWRALKY
jgi:hypothetical protein